MVAKSCMLLLIFVGILFSCRNNELEKVDKENKLSITDAGQQDSLFADIYYISHGLIPDNAVKDSLAFLVLPVKASCPACRNKSIDSIADNIDKLNAFNFVVLSGSGTATIESFFLERKHDYSKIKSKVIVDSTNEAFKRGLIFSKPVIFYAYNKKVYQKVSCVPVNIKKELGAFFARSGFKNSIVGF